MHPIAFSVKLFGYDLTVRWYGLMYVIAIIVGIFLVRAEVRRRGLALKTDDILDFVLISVPLGIIFARLWYVLFYTDTAGEHYYWSHPGEIWKIWQGGLAIHGGLLGGFLALLIFAKWKKLGFWQFADALAPAVILGQALGRIGNFLNGDAYGIKTYLPAPFGLEFARGTPAYSYARQTAPFDTMRLHPAMLYEMVGDLIIFGLIWWWLRRRPHKDGFIVSSYLVAYSLVRFAVEFFRGDALVWGSVRIAQAVSVLLIAGFGWLILHYQLYRPKEAARAKEEQEQERERAVSEGAS